MSEINTTPLKISEYHASSDQVDFPHELQKEFSEEKSNILSDQDSMQEHPNDKTNTLLATRSTSFEDDFIITIADTNEGEDFGLFGTENISLETQQTNNNRKIGRNFSIST